MDGDARGLGLPEAPVYRPTEDQFKDPLAFIASIRHEAEGFGICKIIPPASWRPTFQVDTATFAFNTRIQAVNELQNKVSSSAEAKAWAVEYRQFLKCEGKDRRKNPTFSGREIDLFKFHKLVAIRGGYQGCCDQRCWRELARLMGVPSGGSNLAYGIRTLYIKHLSPFDAWKAAGKPEQGLGSGPQPGAAVKPDPEAASPARPSGTSAGERASSATPMDLDAEAEEAASILASMAPTIVGSSAVAGGATAAEGCSSGSGMKRKPSEKQEGPAKRRKSRAKKSDSSKNRVPINIETLLCEECKAGHHEDKIILCDRCDKGFHLFCLSPPLSDVPEGEWICPNCTRDDSENIFFRAGCEMTFAEMEEANDAFISTWLGGKSPKHLHRGRLEKVFWDIVESGEEPVEVFYGADLDTGKVGSGFPLLGKSDNPYATHPWNVNNFPKASGEHGSLLCRVRENIPGVIVPWLYIGMMFSAFCWHVEDHMFYSVNYNHYGAAKQWYAIPSARASDFEATFKRCKPDLFAQQPDVLFHLVTMLSPRILRSNDVPVYSCLQNAGEFVITFPNAYHGGFNHGVNAAEAVNFVPADWLRFGAASMLRYRAFRKPSVLCHEELLLDVAGGCSDRAAFWLARELARATQEEHQLRCNLWASGVRTAVEAPTAVGFQDTPADDHPECAVCKTYLYFHAVECPSHQRGRYCCAHHVHALGDGGARNLVLHYRKSIRELQQLVQDLAERGASARPTNGFTNFAKWVSPVLICKNDSPPLPIPAHLLPPEATAKPPAPLAGTPHEPRYPSTHRPPAKAPSPVAARSLQLPDSERAERAEDSDASHQTQATQDDPATQALVASANASAGVAQRPATVALCPGSECSEDPLAVKPLKDGEAARAALAHVPIVTRTGSPSGAECSADCVMDDSPHSTAAGGAPQRPDGAGSHPCASSGGGGAAEVKREAEDDKAEAAARPTGGSASGTGGCGGAQLVDKLTAEGLGRASAGVVYETRYVADVGRVRAALATEAAAWMTEAEGACRGGRLHDDAVAGLLRSAGQFLWGEMDPGRIQGRMRDLESGKQWLKHVKGLLRSKTSLDVAEPLLARDDLPQQAPAVVKLKAAVETTRTWIRRLADARASGTPMQLATCEDMLEQGLQLPLQATEVVRFQEAITRAREARDAIRSLLFPPAPARAPTPVPSSGPGDAAATGALGPSNTAAVDAATGVVGDVAPVATVATGAPVQGYGEADTACAGRRVMLADRDLKAQQQRVAALKITFPELAEVERLLAEAEGWKERVRGTTQVRSPLAALQALLEEGRGLRVSCAELEPLEAQIAAAEKWMASASAAIQQRKPLREMRKLLHAGERMAVEIDAVAELKRSVRAREWEESAGRALSGRISVASAQQLVAEAAAMGVPRESPALTRLEAALAQAHAWDAEAAALLTRCEAVGWAAGDDGADPGGSAETGAPAPRAASAAAAAGSAPPPTLEDFNTCAAAATNLELRCERYTAMVALQTRAHQWQQDALAQLSKPADLPALRACVRAGRALGLSMPALEDLETRLGDIEGVQRRAASLLAMPAGQLTLESVQAVLATAKAACVEVPEIEALVARKAVLKWEAATRRDLGALLGVAGAQKPTLETVCVSFMRGQGRPVDAEMLGAVRDAAMQALAWEVSAAPMLLQEPPYIPEALRDSPFDGTHPAVTSPERSANGRFLLASARRLLDQGSHCAAVVPSLSRLSAALSAQEQLENECTRVLLAAETWSKHAASTAASSADPTGAAAAPEAPPDDERVSLESLNALITRCEASVFDSPALQGLRECAAATTDALQGLRKLLAPGKGVSKGGGSKGERALGCVAASAQRCRVALDAALFVPGTSATAAAPSSPELNCLCQQVYEEGQQMIGCDTCGGWFHLRCCAVSTRVAQTADTWECPVCRSLRDGGDHVAPHIGRVHSTAAPPLAKLQDSLAALRAQVVCVPEEAVLSEAVGAVEQWLRRVRALMQQPAPSAVAFETWLEVARQSAAIEVDMSELWATLRGRMQLERWASRVQRVLDGRNEGGRPGVEALEGMLEEAQGVPGAPVTAAFRRASEAVAEVKELVKQGHAIMAQVKGEAGCGRQKAVHEQLAALKRITFKLQALPVRDVAALETFSAAATTYCICQLPGGREQDMVACGTCSQLYHLACLGIPKAKEPKRLVCPYCTAHAGEEFAWADDMPEASRAGLYDRCPQVASVAIPTRAPPVATPVVTSASPTADAAVQADSPTAAAASPTGDNMVSLPRGYVDYLENIISLYAPHLLGGGPPPGPESQAAPLSQVQQGWAAQGVDGAVAIAANVAPCSDGCTAEGHCGAGGEVAVPAGGAEEGNQTAGVQASGPVHPPVAATTAAELQAAPVAAEPGTAAGAAHPATMAATHASTAGSQTQSSAANVAGCTGAGPASPPSAAGADRVEKSERARRLADGVTGDTAATAGLPMEASALQTGPAAMDCDPTPLQTTDSGRPAGGSVEGQRGKGAKTAASAGARDGVCDGASPMECDNDADVEAGATTAGAVGALGLAGTTEGSGAGGSM